MLGDAVHEALAAVGVTPARVARWVGPHCDCEDRRAKLNALDLWARQAARGTIRGVKEHLLRLIGDGN